MITSIYFKETREGRVTNKSVVHSKENGSL
jgi:hypothetical protein